MNEVIFDPFEHFSVEFHDTTKQEVKRMMQTYMRKNHPDKRKGNHNDEMMIAQNISLLQEFVKNFEKYQASIRGKYHPLVVSVSQQQSAITVERYESCIICWNHAFGQSYVSCIHCKRKGNCVDSSGNMDICIPCAGSGFMRVVHVRPASCEKCSNVGIVTKKVCFDLSSINTDNRTPGSTTIFDNNGHQILCLKTGTTKYTPLIIQWE